MDEPSSINCFSSKNYAVFVQNLSKSYGTNQVLQNVSMHVEEGTVYGLLGSSGCGKTTLLSCMLNLKKWDSGEVFIFGKRINKEEEIDPRNIGYMPQDLALYEQLTVNQMMRYFSKLYGMTGKQFDEVMRFLEDLMNLPGYRFRTIGSLSGGQQRRISLSLTLIHKPKLLILDEPTVGLDPLLRESLWNYLYNLTITNKTSLIITTHYIEEVKRANMVGVMRKGRLLVEEDPALLMRTHQTLILEEVVRKICYKDSQDHGINSLLNNTKTPDQSLQPVKLLRICCNEDAKAEEKNHIANGYNNHHHNGHHLAMPVSCSAKDQGDFEPIQVQISKENLSNNNNDFKNQSERSFLNSVKRSLAYSQVVLINFMRHPMFIFLVLFLPPFQLFTTGTVMGVEPKFTPIGIVNHEIPNWETSCAHQIFLGTSGNFSVGKECDLSALSCYYIKYLYRDNYIKPIPFDTAQAARSAVDQGNIQGYIQIPGNFSKYIIERAVAIQFATDETIDGTTILIDLDFTEFIKMFVVTSQMFQAFGSFVKEFSTLCNIDLHLVDIPFFYRHPVYGTMDGSAQEYALPAVIAGIIFEISFCVTPLVLVNDIRYGTLERSRAAGLRFPELMAGLFLQIIIMALAQGLICYLSIVYGLNSAIHGNPFLYFTLCLVTALCGGTFGLFIGVYFKDEITVIISAIFVLPILMLYVGTLRPAEIIAMPYRTLVYYFFPSAAIVKSFRFVINRDLGLLHGQVWPGILITLGWVAVFSLLSLITIKRSKS